MFRVYGTNHRMTYVGPGENFGFTITPIRRGPNRRQGRKAAAKAKLAAAAVENVCKQTPQTANPHSEVVKHSSKVVDPAAKSTESITQPAAQKGFENVEVEKDMGEENGIEVDSRNFEGKDITH
ncbi:hypothetical protein EAE96_009099 [Botrytis aclada]|nr:hypothetical protein EAE96_009099 [Botrytis aclada]